MPPESAPASLLEATDSALSISSEDNAAARAWTERQLNPYRQQAIEQHAGDSFLDVGCGNGQYVFRMADDFETAGVDIQSYPSWTSAEDRFRVGDAAALPYDSASFDTVVSFETLEHVPDPDAVLREFHRVCRRNIIFSVPNCELPPELAASRLTYFHYTDQSHVNFFTQKTLQATVEANGFRVKQIGLINPCPTRPLLTALFGLPGLVTRVLDRFVRRDVLQMTILVVAEKVEQPS
ncbi:MAG: class I SAM-dependent methyltransferase [Planctomycetaceae bacterium]|nr:class I SAM-dependent methyltransferase [Planctomycetaceae bacterium]